MSWMSQLLPSACLTNAFGSTDEAWPSISLEALVAADPDWLITSSARGDDRLASLPGWRDLTAVREGRIIRLPDDLLARSGPTVGDWIALVAEAVTAVR
jgi:iron complex transport system substrate-binding protein